MGRGICINKSGFTLVELSIVLVVIGLLIGGILVGRSLVDSVKVSKVINEINRYTIVVDLFKDKFRQYPGDSDLFTNPGDRSGTIDYPGSGATGEWTRNWQHLGEAGMLNGEAYSGVRPSSAGNAGVPDSEIVENAFFTIWYTSANTHQMRIGDQQSNGLNSFGVFSPVFAMSIDAKIDDGLADSGDLGPILWETFEPNCLANTTGGPNPYTAGDYNVSDDSGLCSIKIDLDF